MALTEECALLLDVYHCRTFFSYSIEAIYLSMIMMITFACVSNPITMLCALALLSMMLSAHPTFGDISLWLVSPFLAEQSFYYVAIAFEQILLDA